MTEVRPPQFYAHPEDAPAGARRVDAYESALTEVFLLDHPQLKREMPGVTEQIEEFRRKANLPEVWIYFPWRHVLVRTVGEEIYFRLRTARNRDLISDSEQEGYRSARVGIAGLSVGSGALHALVLSGGPKTIKIADFDNIEITNLNRIRATLPEVGENKTVVAARQVWELDPWADLKLWGEGLTSESLRGFIMGDPALTAYVDEMDSLDLKMEGRLTAREARVPVLMATDNGDSVVLDVERFDLEPDRPVFHGLLEDMPLDRLRNADFRTWLEAATKMVGPEYLTPRMQASLLEVGRKIPAVPQLGTTAQIAGAAIAFAVRRIANGEEMPSGRYVLGLEEKLIPHYNDEVEREKRQRGTESFGQKFGSP